MRVLVTGPTGFIGINLCRLLKQQGHYVRALIRTPAKQALIADSIDEAVYGDITAPDSLKGICQSMDIVFHLSGLTKSTRLERFLAVNYFGTVHVAKEAARAKGLRRFVLLSSLAAGGPSAEGARGQRPDQPVSFYGQSKLMAEWYIGRAGIPFTIVRPPIVYGPWERDVLAYFKMARRRVVPVMGQAKPFSVVYVADLVSILTNLMEDDRASGKVLHVAENRTYSFAAIIRAIARSMGVRPWLVPIPQWLLIPAAVLYEWLANSLHLSPLLTRDKVSEIWQCGWVSDSTRATDALGLQCPTPLERGTQLTCAWYKQNGWL